MEVQLSAVGYLPMWNRNPFQQLSQQVLLLNVRTSGQSHYLKELLSSMPLSDANFRITEREFPVQSHFRGQKQRFWGHV